MKKIYILLLFLVVLVICYFIKIKQSAQIDIESSYYNVYRQLAIPANWINWLPELKSITRGNDFSISDSKTDFKIQKKDFALKVENIAATSFLITKTTRGKSNTFSVTVIPGLSETKAVVTVEFQTSLISYLKSLITNDNIKDTSIPDLKNYMENTLLYYGFLIKKEQNPEKLIAVKKGVFLKNDAYSLSSLMLGELNDFISKNNLKIVQPLQMQYVSAKNDSLQITLGLPVNKMIPVSNNIEYMTMPKGKALVGYYKGKYKMRGKLYRCMQVYMNDNYIHPMIAPFERFENNKLPVSDSTMVDMQVVIPYM